MAGTETIWKCPADPPSRATGENLVRSFPGPLSALWVELAPQNEWSPPISHRQALLWVIAGELHLPIETPGKQHTVLWPDDGGQYLAPSEEFSLQSGRAGSTFLLVAAETTISEPSEPYYHVCRQSEGRRYDYGNGAVLNQLFGKPGGEARCGGFGIFEPGTKMACHSHSFPELIIILSGQARCQVQGRSYALAPGDAAAIPAELAHRFCNETSAPLRIAWIYASSEPIRQVLPDSVCEIPSGSDRHNIRYSPLLSC